MSPVDFEARPSFDSFIDLAYIMAVNDDLTLMPVSKARWKY